MLPEVENRTCRERQLLRQQLKSKLSKNQFFADQPPSSSWMVTVAYVSPFSVLTGLAHLIT